MEASPKTLCIGAQIQADPRKSDAFFALAKETFSLPFAYWNAQGWWDPNYYRPYTCFDADLAVSNVSVNRMPTRVGESLRNYVQLGTVMTAPAYRQKGLCRTLLQQALADCGDAHGVYLFANDSVLRFYPKFGFKPGTEYEHSFSTHGQRAADVRRLDPDCAEDLKLLYDCYRQGDPYAALWHPDCRGLLLFYCGIYLKECIFYSPSLHCAAVLEQDADETLLYEFFGSPGVSLQQAAAAFCGSTKIRLGFTPKDTAGLTVRALHGQDDTVFTLQAPGKEDPLQNSPLRFPLLFHA